MNMPYSTVLVVLVLAARSAGAAPSGADLVDFSSPAVIKWAAASGMSASPIMDSSGKPIGTEMAFNSDYWRGLIMNVPAEIPLGDWRAWENVVLDVENLESKDIIVNISFRNVPDTWDDGKVAAFYVTIPAGKRVTWPVRIFHLRYTLGWEWPLLPWGGKTGAWGRVNTGAVAEVWIGMGEKNRNARLGLFRLRLETPIAATGWIDRYGQRANLEWPLKVHRDEDLKAADRREIAELTKAKVHPVFDEYHAWKKGPVRRATGFFRVEEVDDRWWLIAPNGRLYYMTGIDCMGPWNNPHVDDVVRAAYSWWPPTEGPLSGAWGFWWQGKYYTRDNSPSLYRANLIRKWGPDGLDQRALKRALDRVLAWQFTSIGNWSDGTFVGMKKKLPYVTTGPDMGQVKTPWATKKIHDAFDPGFPEEAHRVAAKLAEHKDNPWCIGHFVTNEVDWLNIPSMVLGAEPSSAARERWIGALKRQYGDVEKLNATWGGSATSFATLRWPDKKAVTSTAWVDAAEFRGEFAEAWYRIWGEAIRAADPNHLVLGSRFSNRPEECVAAAGRHMDIVSFNEYSERPEAEHYDKWYAMTGKPMLIGEYGFNSLDDGLLTTAVPVANREERGVGYRYYTEQLAALPHFIGGHYFQWIDEPITGRNDRETAFNGFLKVTDIPDPFLVKAAKKTNPRVYLLHSGKSAPFARRPKR